MNVFVSCIVRGSVLATYSPKGFCQTDYVHNEKPYYIIRILYFPCRILRVKRLVLRRTKEMKYLNSLEDLMFCLVLSFPPCVWVGI